MSQLEQDLLDRLGWRAVDIPDVGDEVVWRPNDQYAAILHAVVARVDDEVVILDFPPTHPLAGRYSATIRRVAHRRFVIPADRGHWYVIPPVSVIV